jgi:hypothetical protein
VIDLLSLAQHSTEKSLWDPTILGILVVASGLVLFCGSVYLLLATNMGGRLGFLVSAAALTGLMVLLSTVWLITATPLNSPRGRLAEWKPVEVVDDYSSSSIDAVQSIEDDGEPIPEAQWADIRPAVDASLAPVAAEGEEEAEPSEFIVPGVEDPSDIIIVESFQTGGDARFLFWHEPLYQAVRFCIDNSADDPEPQSLEVEPPPECDPAIPEQVAVFERDLGSLRQPPALFLLAFSVLFGLSLLGLHWRERDERAAAARASSEVTP